jgi:hypothetical protein
MMAEAGVIVFPFLEFFGLEVGTTFVDGFGGKHPERGGHLVESINQMVFALEKDVDVIDVGVFERFARKRREIKPGDDDLTSMINALGFEAARGAAEGAERYRNRTQL